jgi:PucR family transcriptional regulator, purine catabolism regulatory protein
VFLSVREVLALPQVQRGHPQVLAGEKQLHRMVRWVHVLELQDVAGLLQGGELVLTTGVGLPHASEELRHYVAALHDSGVCGLVLELGSAWHTAPASLVRAAERHELPLVVLHTPVQFVTITEAVHAAILHAQYGELQASERLHQVFTRLGVEGSDVQEILEEAVSWSDAPMVLESPAHRVLAVALGGHDRQTVLRDWEHRSRRVVVAGGTGTGGPEPWLVTPVGARGRSWGRLVLQPGGEPTARQVMVLERAASALALNRLIERDQQSLERQAHRNVLTDLVGRRQTEADLHARTAALGVPTSGKVLVGLVVRTRSGGPTGVSAAGEGARVGEEARAGEEAGAVATAVERSRSSALVAPFGRGVGVLLTLARAERRDRALRRLAEHVHRHLAEVGSTAVIGVGGSATTLADAAVSLDEAAQVAEAASSGSIDRPYLELADVRLRGLLALLRDDSRLQVFVERELGPLLAEPGPAGEELMRTLRGYLAAGRNKSAAAERLHLSRPAFYHRIEQLRQVLDVDLDDVESCLSLHVALMALEVTRGGSTV